MESLAKFNNIGVSKHENIKCNMSAAHGSYLCRWHRGSTGAARWGGRSGSWNRSWGQESCGEQRNRGFHTNRIATADGDLFLRVPSFVCKTRIWNSPRRTTWFEKKRFLIIVDRSFYQLPLVTQPQVVTWSPVCFIVHSPCTLLLDLSLRWVTIAMCMIFLCLMLTSTLLDLDNELLCSHCIEGRFLLLRSSQSISQHILSTHGYISEDNTPRPRPWTKKQKQKIQFITTKQTTCQGNAVCGQSRQHQR